jgi:hypothetical protein
MNRNSPRVVFESRAAISSLSHQTQLVFRRRALQPEQQPVVNDARIIGAIRIDNQCAGKRAQINE